MSSIYKGDPQLDDAITWSDIGGLGSLVYIYGFATTGNILSVKTVRISEDIKGTMFHLLING